MGTLVVALRVLRIIVGTLVVAHGGFIYAYDAFLVVALRVRQQCLFCDFELITDGAGVT